MIVFYGATSQKCRQFIYNKLMKIFFFAGLTTLLIFEIPIILIARNNHPIIYLYCLGPLFQLVLFCFIPKMSIKMYSYNRIEISEDIFSSKVGHKYEFRELSKVKIVKDWGEWYEIIFFFPHKSIGYICQKDLIVEGTIEEFEKLFEDKIVRKSQAKD
ncbi:MAG: hypothetical protein IKA72_00605 [Clostridia bacterium]|nr:hypothetical protein [Clostridia bacterium]